MAKTKSIRMSLGRWIVVGILLSICFSASFVLFKYSSYLKALDEFSLAVKNFDRSEVAVKLNVLKKSYVSFSNLGLQYFADNYLFEDMYKYEAAAAFIDEDWEKAISLLASHEDDHQALNNRGVAKFRILHEAYHSEAAGKDKKIKEEILEKVLEEVRPDFEAAVKTGPGPDIDFNSSYNYDLTSDPEMAKKALESVRPTVRFILGIKVEGDGPKGPNRVRPGDKRIDDPTPGGGSTKKKG